mmetsp:Transcript_44208/g.71041  ORF Transcript_44208/g.71041 Transcript_44208/m.71041 type:complete len:165 (-) Transcript_44208:466-960(-)
MPHPDIVRICRGVEMLWFPSQGFIGRRRLKGKVKESLTTTLGTTKGRKVFCSRFCFNLASRACACNSPGHIKQLLPRFGTLIQVGQQGNCQLLSLRDVLHHTNLALAASNFQHAIWRATMSESGKSREYAVVYSIVPCVTEILEYCHQSLTFVYTGFNPSHVSV